MSLELEHNGKKYKWVEGKKWGVWQPPRWIGTTRGTIYWLFGSNDIDTTSVDTYHTPDQLVSIGYMEEVKEAEWMPEVGEAIVVFTDEHRKWVAVLREYRFWKLYPILCIDGNAYQYAQKIPEPLQSEIKQLLIS
jgi:hypothetical protein